MSISVLPYRDELKVGEGRLFIDGQWSGSSDGGTWTHVHPATNEEVATFAVASGADVDRAVHAARKAFDEGPWPSMKARDRKMLLRRYIDALNDNADEIARLQSLDNGLPINFSSMYQVSANFAADIFDYHTGHEHHEAAATEQQADEQAVALLLRGLERRILRILGRRVVGRLWLRVLLLVLLLVLLVPRLLLPRHGDLPIPL